MKAQSQTDYEKITSYREKNGGTLAMAAVKTGAKLANYNYWAQRLKKARKSPLGAPKLTPKKDEDIMVLVGSSQQILQILGGLA